MWHRRDDFGTGLLVTTTGSSIAPDPAGEGKLIDGASMGTNELSAVNGDAVYWWLKHCWLVSIV